MNIIDIRFGDAYTQLNKNILFFFFPLSATQFLLLDRLFFLDSKLLSAVDHIDYETIVLSDHATLQLQLIFPNIHTSTTW